MTRHKKNGIWLTDKALDDQDTSWREKALLSEVEHLIEHGGICYATNKHFSYKMRISESNVRATIKSLLKKDKIFEEYVKLKGITRRIIYLTGMGLESDGALSERGLIRAARIELSGGSNRAPNTNIVPNKTNTKGDFEETDKKDFPESTSLEKSEAFGPSSESRRLSALLLSLILERKPDFKKPDLAAWAKHIDLAIRCDGRTPERIEAVIRWCQADDFWRNNILSTEKLRKQFDMLELKMGANRYGSGENREAEPVGEFIR